MGQYYIPTFLTKCDGEKPQLQPQMGIYAHNLSDGLKLSESGWEYSPTMCYTENQLMKYGNDGTYFAYAGDYEEPNPNVMLPFGKSNTYSAIFPKDKSNPLEVTREAYDKWKRDRVLLYFVNHDKKQYVPLNITFTEDELSPLAFLCYAGDRYDQHWYGVDRDDELIGAWAYDRVAIVDEIPQDYVNVEPN